MKTLITTLLILAVFAAGSSAQQVLNGISDLNRIDIDEHLGGYIPLDLTFTNAEGKKVAIGDYFNRGKPVLMTLAYYECPMLCTLVLNAESNGVRQLTLIPGRDFQMVTVSIDPDETPELARNKQHRYMKSLGDESSDGGWEFLVGNDDQIKPLADALGFKYFYVKERDEYAHPAAVFVLTEEGKISRYLYGLDFKEKDLRLSLLEASEGKIGSTVDRIILYCFHYDPDAKGYVLFASNVMRAGGVATVIILTIFIGSLWAKEKYRKSHDSRVMPERHTDVHAE